ncbi:hypothetical protein LXA43DRAFT_647545 [Ganoderma leucocontextum]|nr:hypothetical protein LXA43DRAFT_647545 [Ganoderma leucocontextum]
MSSRITRKRARAEEEGEDLPPTKREPVEDNSQGAGPDAAGGAQADGQGSTSGAQGFEKDKEFWFDDGTVILVARNIEFRVYEGLLGGLSPVFKDMFQADGHAVRNVRVGKVQSFPCPVVHVSDSPEDLRRLLRACFSKRLGSLYKEQNPSYNEISAAIRLGDKYKITELYSQSLEYLKYYFPATFASYCALKEYTPPGWNPFEEIGVVNLARITGNLSILPSAFVACICAESTEPELEGIGHGIAREDGSQERLSPGDLTVCLEGKTRLRIATITAVLRTFKLTVSPECKTPTACKKAFLDVLLNLEKKVDELVAGDPLTRYTDFVSTPGGLAVCPSCTTMVGERNLKERRDVWDRLPELLNIDVPGWGKEPSPPPSEP